MSNLTLKKSFRTSLKNYEKLDKKMSIAKVYYCISEYRRREYVEEENRVNEKVTSMYKRGSSEEKSLLWKNL